MSTDWDAREAAMHAWIVEGSGLPAQKIQFVGQEKVGRPAAPAIMAKWYVIDNVGVPWVDAEANPLELDDQVVESVSGNSLVITGHDMLSGDGAVRFTTTGVLPAPLQLATDYWIIRTTDDAVQVAATYQHTGGNVAPNPTTAITLLDAGTGVHTIHTTADSLRAGSEIQYVARGMVRIGLQLFCHTSDAVGMGAAMAILRKVADRAYLPSQQERLAAVNLGLNGVERVRPLLGDKDAVMFQPRAWLDIMMTAAFEEREDGRIIERVTGNRNVPPDAPDHPFEIPEP